MEKNTSNTESSGFNWGKGITLVIVLFIIATLSVVAFIISLDYHMVTDNHYEKAENYQEHIDRVEQAGALEEPVEIKYMGQEQLLQIRFPDSLSAGEPRGTIELYRPNDASKDQKITLQLDGNGIQNISGHNLLKGKWIVKVTWSTGPKSYYHQKSIFL